MYPIPPHEHLVETRTCKHCQTPFPLTDKDMEFYEKISPVFPLEKGGQGDYPVSAGKVQREGDMIRYLIPPPTLCPDCRQQRRLSFRNERKLYKRKCDATGKDIISIYSPDKPYKVYNQDYWWSDAWDPMDYGRDFDFTKGAMEQMRNMNRTIPQPRASITGENENSDYANHSGYMKNSYLVAASWQIENVFYSTRVIEGESCIDILAGTKIRESYENITLFHSYKCFYTKSCSDSHDLLACVECEGCSECILCAGIKNKSYCIENQQYNQKEYFQRKKNIWMNICTHGWEKVGILELKLIHRNLNIVSSEKCIGDGLASSYNCYSAYDASELRDCKYVVISSLGSSDIYDATGFGFDFQRGYEVVDAGLHAIDNYFTFLVHSSNYVLYCMHCFGCDHLFLCIGLRNKQYCILNKQYTKEEYEVLVPRIIEHMMKTGEWGEFFPSSMSPFGYNETVAQEYYPMTREEILGNTPLLGGDARRAEGVVSEISEANPPVSLLTGGSSKDAFLHGPIFNYSDYEPPFPKVEKIIPANKLPDDISKIPDDILNWAIECEVTKKPFRIIPQELAFYRKHNIPIPRRHPDQRHLDRMAQRNPRKLYERLCDCPNCEENAKKSGNYREDEFDFRDPETRSGGLRRRMITTYAPERPETVYCEVCYEREVLG